MNISYWEKTAFLSNVDVLIIGSGIVGLNAALRLKKVQPQLKVLVLERGPLPSGASTKNAGFACFGSVSELLKDLEKMPESEVFGLVEKRWKGLLKLRKFLGDEVMEFQNFGGYELFESSELYEKCEAAIPYFNKQLRTITGLKDIYKPANSTIKTFGFKGCKGMIKNEGEGQIHTGFMMQQLIALALKKGITIINSTTVTKLKKEPTAVNVVTSLGNIKARRVLIATNGFASQMLPELEVNPGRAQVLITKPISNLKVKGTFHMNEGYYYFRNIDNRILFGGGRNMDIIGETTTEFGTTQMIQESLERYLKEMILPGKSIEIDQRWSGIMGLGPVKSPIIKKISKNVFCSVRLGGMGVAIGSLVGEEGADLVLKSL